MSGNNPSRQKTSLAGWFKWCLIVIIPFSALFAETWLNVQTIKRDYKMAQINEKLKQLHEKLDVLKVEKARLENMDRVENEAPNLGLTAPEPNQIQVLEYDEPEQTAPQPAPQLAPPPAQEWAQAFLEESQPGPQRVLLVGGTAPAESEGKTWKANMDTGPAAMTEVMARLRKVIVDAYSSYFGRS